MIVKEFKESNAFIFDKIFAETLPDYCEEETCGFPLEITAALTGLKCTNPRCPSKVTQRLLALLQSLGIKGMGETLAYRFLTERGINNPLYILGYDYEVDGALVDGTDGVSQKISDQLKEKNTFTLAEYVKIANLPYVQSSAVAIFSNYDSLEKAYKDIQEGGIEFVARKIGVNHTSDSVSIRAVRIYESLLLFKQDLFDTLSYVQIKEINQHEVFNFHAVCSDEVGGRWKTKADFYANCNNLSESVHVEFGGSVTKATQYLIWLGADGSPARRTSKVTKAEALQAKYDELEQRGKLKEDQQRLQIVTAAQFFEILKATAGV